MVKVDYTFYIKKVDRTMNFRFRVTELCILAITACFISLTFYIFLISEKIGNIFWLAISAIICFIFACGISVGSIIDIIRYGKEHKRFVKWPYETDFVEISEDELDIMSIGQPDVLALGFFVAGMIIFFMGMLFYL